MGEFLFNLDMQLVFNTLLMAISVFFLFLALSYLLFNPVRKLMKDRQDKIDADINNAIADKKDAAALKAEYEAKLKEIDKEAEEILSEARKKALKNEAKIVEEAKETKMVLGHQSKCQLYFIRIALCVVQERNGIQKKLKELINTNLMTFRREKI